MKTNTDLYLFVTERCNRSRTASQLSREFHVAIGTKFHELVFPQALCERRGTSTIRLLLTSAHRRIRLAFLRKLQHCSKDHSGRSFYSLISLNCLTVDSRRTFIWRKPVPCYIISNFREKDQNEREWWFKALGRYDDGLAHRLPRL
ncbi:hypothetical protein TNCV_2965181 [Trichonephila clavipes]|nr:hypothetical protein TNCV_2965181 [Trichonephila clavipes]